MIKVPDDLDKVTELCHSVFRPQPNRGRWIRASNAAASDGGAVLFQVLPAWVEEEDATNIGTPPASETQ
jgi:hypothetical protein